MSAITLTFLFLASGPSLTNQNGLSLRLAEDFFHHQAVQEQLLSGLTTTLLVTCKPLGKAKGAKDEIIRIDIRYEPWDEVFYVDSWRKMGGVKRETVAGMEALGRWWLERLHPLVGSEHSGAQLGIRWQVTMELLPFSQSDTERAKRWLATSRIPANKGVNADTNLVEGGQDQGTDVVMVMLATSIDRRVLLRRKWVLVVRE